MLTNNLPPIFVQSLAKVMMPALSARITEGWLERGVPSSLNSMVEYQKTLIQVNNFADKLEALNWPGVDLFSDWVVNAPKIWLNKRRETALNWTRNHLALGVFPLYEITRLLSGVVADFCRFRCRQTIHGSSQGNPGGQQK